MVEGFFLVLLMVVIGDAAEVAVSIDVPNRVEKMRLTSETVWAVLSEVFLALAVVWMSGLFGLGWRRCSMTVL